jgi:hypothetical protein
MTDLAQAQRLKPPTTLVLAFWGWVLTAAVRLVGVATAIASRPALVDVLNKANVPSGPQSHPLPEDQIQSSANLIVGTSAVMSAVIAGFFLFFAFKLWAGRNWARILLIFAALVDLLLFAQSGDFSPLSVVSALIAIATIVLSYLRPSTDYIAAVRESRRR